MRIVSAKFDTAELTETQKEEFVTALRKLDQSLDALGSKAPTEK